MDDYSIEWGPVDHTGGDSAEAEMVIPEIDIDQLHDDLYAAWRHLQKHDYHSAEVLVAKSWRHVQLFRLSLDDRALPATTDRDIRALLTKAIYRLLNIIGWRRSHRCKWAGYGCEYVYPYGFVPEGGCPYHD